MKKIVIIGIGLLSILMCNNHYEEVMIPKEAIRFRIIANSNKETDQQTKLLVRDKLENQIINDLDNVNSINKARNTINKNINRYEKIIQKTLEDNNVNTEVSINYGINYFPEKTYKGIKYKAGNYESLVVNIGEGLGKNWWCVLFPPLCLLEAEENQEKEEVEYKFFVKELIDKYLK